MVKLLKKLSNTIDVLQKLKNKGFLLKTTKCKFFEKEVEILGHKIKNNTLQPLEKNIEAVKNLKQPKTLRQVRKILGVLNYHRKLIRNFADLAKLYDVLKGKDSKDNAKLEKDAWGPLQEEAFEKIKVVLTTYPILEIYDPEAMTYLEVDASQYAIGGVLKQISRKTSKPVTLGYFSEKIPKCKKHLGSFDLELLAITRSCEYFRQYLLDKKFTVFTDNEPLTYQNRMKKPSARLARLVTKLGGFTFTLKHISGIKNLVADLLSRHPTIACSFKNEKFEMIGKEIKTNIPTRAQHRALQDKPENNKTSDKADQTQETTNNNKNTASENKNQKKEDQKGNKTNENDPHTTTEKEHNHEIGKNEEDNTKNDLTHDNKKILATELRNDKFWKDVIGYIEYKKLGINPKMEKFLSRHKNLYSLDKNGILYRAKCEKDLKKGKTIIIPDSMIPEILENYHDSKNEGGHFGITKTAAKIKDKFFFNNFKSNIRNYVRTCHSCQEFQNKQKDIGEMQPNTIKECEPFNYIQLDFIGPFQNNFRKNYMN